MSDLFTGRRDLIRLDRRTDRKKPCCQNLAVPHAGKGPHGAELRCAGCGRHRGWLPQEFKTFIDEITRRFGAPVEPIILRDQTITIGSQEMQKSPKQFDNSNSGALFKNENKQFEKHADYRGEVNAAGVDYWLDGWVRTSKKSGTKFISFKLKPKQQETAPTKNDFNDEIPF